MMKISECDKRWFYIVLSGIIGVYCIFRVEVVESWHEYDHWMVDKVEHLMVPVINYPAHSFFPMVCVLLVLFWIIDEKLKDAKKP